MTYFDSHAHYYDARFLSEECPDGVDALLDSLFAGDICGIVNVGTSPDTTRQAIAQARRYPAMYVAAGIHPTDGQALPDPDAALGEMEKLLRTPQNKCVALGEIGLDYHYPDTDRERQMYLFDAQMELAGRLGLPAVIHDRDAHGDVMDVIRRHPGTQAILHSFSGSAEMAAELSRRGHYVSFSGTITFANARKVPEAARAVAPEFLLIETDCPYLAPHPRRGTLNHSGNLVYTNRALAEALGRSEEETARLTRENARRVFGLSEI